MRRIYIFAALVSALAAFSTRSWAQDLDPTVVVSRTYEAGQIQATKPDMMMAVPDSVLRFEMDVDYSVNPSPYKGSYQFRPYSLDIRPESAPQSDRQFFLRLGAGYPLHPVVDAVYTPRLNSERFTMSLYGSHRSYFGNFRSISPISTGADASASLKFAWDKGSRERFPGYRTYTTAGVNGRYDWKRSFMTFDAGYMGIAGKDTVMTRNFDAFRAELRVASNNPAETYFFYDISASYLYGEEKVRTAERPYYLVENDFSLRASLGPVFSRSSRALLDVEAEISDYGSLFSSYSGKFSITPRYIFSKNRWYVNIGAEISLLLGDDRTLYLQDAPAAPMHAGRGQIIYPDVEVAFDAIPNYLNVYAKADGSDSINRYSDLLRRSSFHCVNITGLYYFPMMENTVERINARLGLRGNISSKFIYDLYGGYARYSNMLLDAVVISDPNSVFPVMPAFDYEVCNLYYVNLAAGWHSQDLRLDAKLSYTGTDLRNRLILGFEPSPFTVDFDAVYNWKKRIYVGLHCNAALGRDGFARVITSASSETIVPVRLPGYTDLGLSAEYKFNHRLSVWIYGGNLLNMTIQRVPLYTEGGISLTGGITLSL